MNHNKNIVGIDFFIKGSSEKLKWEIDNLSYKARQAYLLRDYRTLGPITDRLLKLPGRGYSRGLYFLALAFSKQGADGKKQAYSLHCNLAECSDPAIRAGAYLHLASRQVSISHNLDEAFYFANQALRVSLSNDWCAPLVTAQVQNLMGVVLSIKGDHKASLEIFSKTLPLMKAFGPYHPPLYFDSLNSLAVELSEVGQRDYASHLIKQVAASPCFSIYPEWQASYGEIINSDSQSQARVYFPGYSHQEPAPSNRKSEMLEQLEQVVRITNYIKEHPEKAVQEPADELATQSLTPKVRPFRPHSKFVRRLDLKLYLDMILIGQIGRETVAYSMEMDNYPIENYIDFYEKLDTISVNEMVGVDKVRFELWLVNELGEKIERLRKDIILEDELDTLAEWLTEFDDWVVQPYFDDVTQHWPFDEETDGRLLSAVLEYIENEN